MPAKKAEGLEQLFLEDLQDLLDAEKQLVRALPKMAKSASDEELSNALREHLEVTKGQVQRLEEVFESMDMRAKSKPCKGMKGIVEEGQEILQEDHQESLMDSAITAAARKVEHYEMVGYESARSLAQQLGRKDAAQLLQQTLQEEEQADRQLAQIAKRLLKEARSAGQEMGMRESGGSRSARRGSPAGSASRSRGGARQASRRTAAAASGRRSGNSRGSASRTRRGASAHPLTDHDEIRQWAEQRGGTPACVRGTGGRGDTGMIRLDFPGYSGADSLQEISWDDWFEKFDERGLALMVQDATARGQKSNFNKLVSRGSAGPGARARAAR